MKVVSSILPDDNLKERLQKSFPHLSFHFFKGMKEAQEHLNDAHIFISFGNDLTEEHILGAKNLQWIMVMSAGIEDIPLQACKDQQIIITNARGIHTVPMSEFVIGLILHHEKRIAQLLANEREAHWTRKLSIGELSGKTMLILGTGAIGSAIARLATAFNIKTIGMNRSGRQVNYFNKIINYNDLSNVLHDVDYLISVLPSTKETYHLLKEDHFKIMKNSAIFCNVGRGDVVSEQVLLNVANNNEIEHLFLDVFNEEPLKEDHPFWQHDKITITPHISSISDKYLERAFSLFEDNLQRFINDEKLANEVNYEKGY